MTITVADVLAWKPELLGAAGATVGTAQTTLDTILSGGVTELAAITWTGIAGTAARTRMDTEQTRGSAVSAALLKLSTALNSQVDNLTRAQARVQAARDAAVDATGPDDCPGFDVDEVTVTVSAAGRLDWWGKKNLNPIEMANKTIEENHAAAKEQLALATALADADGIATAAIAAVDKARADVDTAYGNLGDPISGALGEQPAPAAPAVDAGDRSAAAAQAVSATVGQHRADTGIEPSLIRASNGESGGPPPSEMPTGTEKEWIDQAIEILRGMGYDTSDPNLVNDLATIIGHESGADPLAINGWDSNAAGGHPSKGLMQTIDSTFNAYAAPGHGDIWNPVDNIVAGARYAFARYGSVHDVPGLVSMREGGAYQGY